MRQGGDIDDKWGVCGRILYFSIVAGAPWHAPHDRGSVRSGSVASISTQLCCWKAIQHDEESNGKDLRVYPLIMMLGDQRSGMTKGQNLLHPHKRFVITFQNVEEMTATAPRMSQHFTKCRCGVYRTSHPLLITGESSLSISLNRIQPPCSTASGKRFRFCLIGGRGLSSPI